MSVDIGRLASAFATTYARPAEVLSVAPGRVNLIGEHTDYNDGFVLPVGIDRTVAVVAAVRDDGMVTVRSLDYDECDQFELDNAGRSAGWKGYVRGVAWVLQEEDHPLKGADLAISGDVPQGAGLSSSAAVEVAIAGALTAVMGVALPPVETARMARRAENEFVGVPCGIMDQFAAALSRGGHALLIDCRSQEVEHVPLPFERAGVVIVVIDSRVPRRLGETEYGRRREECREAARFLGVESLRDADSGLLEQRRDRMPDAVYRRARHVVTENGRVLEAINMLRNGEVGRFGQLMYESHASLRDDFDVSCRELDLLVSLASRTDGVLGARLTGAGFGGCTVNLVRAEAIDRFREEVVERYRQETGLAAETHICRAVDGLKVTHV